MTAHPDERRPRPTLVQRLDAWCARWLHGARFWPRPVCWRCTLPFSDWFVWRKDDVPGWGIWSYCYPCHDADRIVILEPAARREAFYD